MTDQFQINMWGRLADPKHEAQFQESVWSDRRRIIWGVFGLNVLWAVAAIFQDIAVLGIWPLQSWPQTFRLLAVVACIWVLLEACPAHWQWRAVWACASGHAVILFAIVGTLMSGVREPVMVLPMVACAIAIYTLILPGRGAVTLAINIIGTILLGIALMRQDASGAVPIASVLTLLLLWLGICQWLMRKWAVMERRGFLRESELRDAEAELRFRADAGKTLLEGSGAYAELIHPDGRRVLCNSIVAKVFGVDARDLIGTNIYEAIPESNARHIRESIERVVTEGSPVLTEIIYDDRNLKSAFYPVEGVGGQVGLIAHYMWDVTRARRRESELRQAKQQADAANSAKTGFLAHMSHELRTPLNAVIGFADLLLSPAHDLSRLEKTREYLIYIHQSGEHLLELINNLLDLSKIEAGHYELVEEVFDCDDVIAQALTCVMPQAEQGGIHLEHSPQEAPVRIRADRTAALRILINLLSNAVKFTEQGGHVDVSAIVDTKGVHLAVSDTGIGMTEPEIKKALALFGQVSESVTKRQEGTGLGLPLVQRLTDLHGGEFKIESRPGEGTRADVVLPLSRLDETDTAATG